jgi:hypothetical protein
LPVKDSAALKRGAKHCKCSKHSSSFPSRVSATRSKKRCGLLLPGSTAQRISVDKYNRLTRAVVFLVEIDIAGVLLPDSDVWH